MSRLRRFARARTRALESFARTCALGQSGRVLCAGVLGVTMAVSAGCSSLTTLTVRPTKPSQLELVPAPQLSQRQYKRILLLPPEENVRVGEGIEAPIVGQKDMRYYIGQIEKAMLSKGFEVVSPEIVARA